MRVSDADLRRIEEMDPAASILSILPGSTLQIILNLVADIRTLQFYDGQKNQALRRMRSEVRALNRQIRQMREEKQ